MITENRKYSGQLTFKLNDKRFILYPSLSNGHFSVLYDVGTEYNGKYHNSTVVIFIYRSSKLLIKLKSTQESPECMVIILQETTILLKKETILEIFLDTQKFMTDKFNEKISNLEKTVQIFGEYKLTSNREVVKAAFIQEDFSELVLITNATTIINRAYEWLCSIWPTLIHKERYCLYIDNYIIKDSDSFLDRGATDNISIEVTERCYITPKTQDNSDILLPWNTNCGRMIEHLSVVLGIDGSRIRLFDKEDRPVNEEDDLDIDEFRSATNNDSPAMFYEVKDCEMKCSPMQINNCEYVITIIATKKTALEVKKRLGWKMNVNEKRLIICQKSLLMLDDEIIAVEDELQYCLGKCFDDIKCSDFLGGGGFGNVHKYIEKTTNKTFALKAFILPFNSDSNCSIIREFLALSTLESHPNIVQYFNIYIDGNKISMAMEYVSGGSLREYLDRQTTPLTEDTIRQLSFHILTGLAHLHKRKINHRDIKGPNVLLTETMVAKLCDFGLSKILTDFSTGQLSCSGVVQTKECGTLRWMAPEVITSNKYGLKCDIWSVGATVVEMITGQVPYHGMENTAAFFKIGIEKTIPYPKESLSVTLQDFVACCLNPDVKTRLNVEDLLSLPFFRL